ncbi:MAG: hypothetical protein ACOC0C_00200 [Bacteroidota bacterium]
MSIPTGSLITSFIQKTLVITLITAGVGAILFMTVLKPYFLLVYIPLLFFIALLTLITGVTLIKSLTRQPKRFVNHYFLSIIIKFFAYLIFFVLFIFNNRANALPFTLTFFGLYIIYTTFELTQVLKFTKIKP